MRKGENEEGHQESYIEGEEKVETKRGLVPKRRREKLSMEKQKQRKLDSESKRGR